MKIKQTTKTNNNFDETPITPRQEQQQNQPVTKQNSNKNMFLVKLLT